MAGFNRRLIPMSLSLVLCLFPAKAIAQELEAIFEQIDEPHEMAIALFAPSSEIRDAALMRIVQRGKPDMAAPLIKALRFVPGHKSRILSVLRNVTGVDNGEKWFDWMLWQQAHSEVKPFDGYDRFQADLFSLIDENFRLFLQPGMKHEIRLEEIVWGGVKKDGIPALTNPKLIAAKEADYLTGEDLVFGVEIAGDARAYPLRIMDWHEMLNDVVGGVPVSLAYCTLCGSGILFDTRTEGRRKPFVFGSSGFLFRSNKLMYDHQTHSLWNQFTGRPVAGKLTGSGIRLNVLPLVIASWSEWLKEHPETKALSLETGHQRDYTPGKSYGRYFSSTALMFPAAVSDGRLRPKDYVFGLRITGAEKAWPLTAFKGGRVINDRAGVVELVLVGDAASRTVRAYRSGGRRFRKGPGPARLSAGDEVWKVTEAALIGPGGRTLSRLPGHVAYWFAWSGYLGNAPLFEK